MLFETIPLEELSVDFEDDPKHPKPPQLRLTGGFGQAQPAQEPPEPTDMEAVLQILRRSTRLSTFTFIAGVLSRKRQLEDQARLLASLPASLETLSITSDLLYHGSDVVADLEQISKALELFLELKMGDCFKNLTALSMLGVVIHPKLLVAMLEHSPKLKELNVDGCRASRNNLALA